MKKGKQRRSAIHSVKNNGSISDGTEKQIFDRGKANETNVNNSTKRPDTRKYTVLRIAVIKHGRNQSSETPKVLSVLDDLKGGNLQQIVTTPRNKSLNIMKGTNVPLTFQVNSKESSEEDIPLNDLYSDKPLPHDKHHSSENKERLLPPQKETSQPLTEKPEKPQGQSDSNVLLEAKLNPLRIGIQLDDDKKNEAESTTQQTEKISLQDVLKDIDDTSRKANPSLDESDADKVNSVLISLNDGNVKDNHSTSKQQHLIKGDGNLGKLHIQATSNKENRNGTEVNTAGVSITTESKGLQTDGLMKVLLTKLLGSDIKDALKEKVAEELKSTSNQKTPSSLDMASTTAAGTTVESPPGTIKGVDTAEMNNNGGGGINVEPPSMLQTSPQCVGGGSQQNALHSTGARVPGNLYSPGGRDCSSGMGRVPSTNMASSLPTGMIIESAPGTQQAVGTGIPPPAGMAPNPPPLVPSNARFGSTTPAGVVVESPPGTIQAVGTSIPEKGISQMGDNGKIRW